MDGFLGRRVTGSDLHIKGSVLKCREGIVEGQGGGKESLQGLCNSPGRHGGGLNRQWQS